MTQSRLWQPSDIAPLVSDGETDQPKKRGRIPQTAWPRILERYRAGVTLSAIAREFDCTPGAISYIIRKAEMAETVENESQDGAEKVGTLEEKPLIAASAAAVNPASPECAEPRADSERLAARAEVRPSSVASAPPAPVVTRAPAMPAAPVVAQPGPIRHQAHGFGSGRPLYPPRSEGRGGEGRNGEERLKLRTPGPAPAPLRSAEAAASEAASAPVSRSEPVQPPVQTVSAVHPLPPQNGEVVETRLRDSAAGCLTAYRDWRLAPTEQSVQALGDAVHELRKTLARIEIDMSVSRRDDKSLKPMPIPQHRSSRPGR
ncbi:Helix-turn-helix domain-containing protein [uncultured Gammaproteobacteria bacterium]